MSKVEELTNEARADQACLKSAEQEGGRSIEQLIQQYCPDGVEFVPLGEVCDIHKGVQFNKSDMNDTGTYPVINGGINPSGYVEVFNEDKDTITISQGGASAGYVNFLKSKFWLGAHCYAVIPDKRVLNRYLYHFTKQNEVILQQCQYGAGIPALAKGTISSLEIPVPPLPVQEEIVRILDTFTELQAELQAELQKRKQQYNYYRDKLLTERNGEALKITDFAILKAGKAIKAEELTDVLDAEHQYPCYGGNGIRGYIGKQSHHGEFAIIGRQGALCGCVNWASNDFYATEHAVVCIPKKNVYSRYLYYLFDAANLNQYKSQGAQPGLSVQRLNELSFNIPSLSEQQRIVSILDRFDTLTNDLTQGIPAEIEARKQQYEYYRDQLLTFKRKEV